MKNPTFLYGTAWKENETQRCVENALQAGFRAIDTANQRKHYFEMGVGAALEALYSEGQITRMDLFLQTKFTSIGGQDRRLPYDPEAAPSEQVKQSFKSSLEHLHTDFLDSYILHGPSSSRGLVPDDLEIWHAMEELYQEGTARQLGISNVTLEQLQLLCEKARVKPAFVQNRCFASQGWDRDIRGYCSKNQIVYQGFSLLTANREIFQDPRFLEIIHRMGCTPAQAVFRFASQIGMLPITGTTNPLHMKEDLDSMKFDLNDGDIQTIESLSEN